MHSRTKQGVQKLRCMGIDTSVITKCADISNSQAFPCTQIGKWGGGTIVKLWLFTFHMLDLSVLITINA